MTHLSTPVMMSLAVALAISLLLTWIKPADASRRISIPKGNIGKALSRWSGDDVYFDYYKSASHCARDCLYYKACKSFIFRDKSGNCSLLSVDSSTNKLVDSEGSVFSDIKDWPKEMAGSCSDSPCELNEKCIPAQPYKCIPDCGRHFAANSFYYLSCSTVGCRRTFGCINGYVSTSSTMYVDCLANGTWTPYMFECVPQSTTTKTVPTTTTRATELNITL